MGADKGLPGEVHGAGIQWSMDPGRAASQQAATCRSVEDRTDDSAPPPRSGRENPRPPSCPINGDVAEDSRWRPATQLRGSRLHGIEMDHLADRMHPGIGATGTTHPHRVCCHLPQRRLELTLHRSDPAPLYLPAPEGTTVVFDTECNSHNKQGRLSAPCPISLLRAP